MKERVGDEKLIIISVTVGGINDTSQLRPPQTRSSALCGVVEKAPCSWVPFRSEYGSVSIAPAVIGTAHIVFGAGSMKRYGVRPSVCLLSVRLSVPAWVYSSKPAGSSGQERCRSIAVAAARGGRMRAVPHCQLPCEAERRLVGKAVNCLVLSVVIQGGGVNSRSAAGPISGDSLCYLDLTSSACDPSVTRSSGATERRPCRDATPVTHQSTSRQQVRTSDAAQR